MPRTVQGRKRFVIVGTGGRAKMYVDALAGDFSATNELVAFCDVSQKRMDWHNQRLVDDFGQEPVPTYLSGQFDAMVSDTRPDVVIVTSMDSTHHKYIVRAMQLGCDAMTEKPMTIDAEKARQIFAAIDETGRQLRVTFNYRYAPLPTKVRSLLADGIIGRPLHVNFQWVLDTYHGADYFRRWHREKDKSGGLLVHKATHHFDLVNWWLQSYPREVFAMGDLMFYGRANANARGEEYSYDRYTGVAEAAVDPFALHLDKTDTLRGLYLQAEAESGYLRDRNVFGDNISAEDTMSVTARYRNGVLLTYSLVAYSPWEGHRIALTGTKGRLEVEVVEQVGKQFVAGAEETVVANVPSPGLDAAPKGLPTPEAEEKYGGKHIRVYPMFGVPYEVEIPEGKGGHGGGDRIMLEQLFSPSPPPDPYDRAASHVDGAASILLGIAANQSIATNRLVCVDDLLPLPEAES